MWKSELLGNVVTLQRGYDLPYRLRKQGPIPIVTSSGIEDTHCEARIKGPGVVTGRYGTIGQVFFVQGDFWPLNTTLYVRDFHGNDPRYVSYLLRTIDFHSHSGKSGVPGVNRNDLHEIAVLFPPIKSEQQAIAEALSDADALIESLEQLIAKKRHIKQGAMQELLTGKKRLHGFADGETGYKQTEAGVIPEDWDVVHMGNVAECFIGLTYSPADVRNFGTLVLRSSNIQNGRLVIDDNVFVDMEVSKRAITQKDDILVCVRNGSRQLIGKCALIDEKVAGSAFGAFMSVLRSASAHFLFAQFQSDTSKRQINDIMGATINQITNKDMEAFKVIWPPTQTEREAIVSVLSDIDAEIVAIEAKLNKARQIKQGMMQELLTGRIRLVKREAE